VDLAAAIIRLMTSSRRRDISWSLSCSSDSLEAGFVMTDTEHEWPAHYNPGSHKHLHALGVIAVEFASLERSLDTLYANRARKENFPEELTDLFYFTLNEEKRIEAIRTIFRTRENDGATVILINNILDYFQWCRNCRNQLLHAERYPPSFGGDTDLIYFVKRLGKQMKKTGYMKLSVRHLRYIADRIHAGVVQCATIHLYRDDRVLG